MIKRLSFLWVILLIIMGCDKGPSMCCDMVDTSMRIAVQSPSNLDLLDPISRQFSYENIDVYDKTVSGYAKVFDINMDQPKRFSIFRNSSTGRYELSLGLNTNTVGDVSETLIRFGNNVPDTIRAVINRKHGISVSKVTIGAATFRAKELYTFTKD